MIRDITIGQYYPGESWVHRLDARIKIIISIMYIIQLFIAKDFLGFILAVAALAALAAVTTAIVLAPASKIGRASCRERV